MLDICLLGTGGTMPMPDRALTSLIVRYKGKNILIDCGEGTQIMVRKSGFSLKKIDTILITHFHADHIAGLPGLLLSIGKSERTEPVKIIGGKGIKEVVKSLCIIAPELPFETECVEIENKHEVFHIGELRIESLLLKHSMTCYGYSINLDRQGKFQPQKALSLGIPQQYWGTLQKGENIELDHNIYTPHMVLGEPRKGLKVTYCTDTRPCDYLTEFVKNSDLFVCEGMYAEEDKFEKALSNKHMMFREAAQIANAADVKELWLTHFSPSLNNPEDYADFACGLFEHTLIPSDLQKTELNF